MITGLILFLYCVLLAVSIYFMISEYKRKKILTAFLFLQAAFVLYYIIIPVISLLMVILNIDELKGFLERVSYANSYDLTFAFLYTLIAYIIIMVIYRIKLLSPKKTSVNLEQRDINSKVKISNKLLNQKIFRVAVGLGLITLVIGLVSELLISKSLGGILEALSMGDKMRGFNKDNTNYIPQDIVFVKVLMVSSLASIFLFVYALRLNRKFTIKILLLISIFTGFFYFFFEAGRMAILLFLLTFVIDLAFRKTKHPFIFIFLSAFLFLFLLGLLDDLFFYLSYGYVKESTSGGLVTIINEFAFPYVNLLNVNYMNDLFGLRWGMDFFLWMINIIPSSILNVFGMSKITQGYQYITLYYSSGSSTGGIPTDLLTLGIRQFGILGVLIIGTIISLFTKYFDKVINTIHSNDFMFITVRISSIMFLIVPYADLDAFVRNRYDMIIILLFAVFVSKIKKMK